MRGVVGLVCLTACRFGFDTIAAGDATNGTGDGLGDGFSDDGAVVGGAERMLSTTGDCGAVAWSGDRAAVVWREAANVRYATVDPTASILDGPITLASNLTNLDCPAIAWTGAKFFVTIPYGGSARDIDATTVTGATSTAFVNIVTDSADSRSSSIAVQGTDVAVAWQSLRGNNVDVVVKRTAPDGSSTYNALVASSSVSSAPATVFDGTGFRAFWVAANQLHANQLALATTTLVGEQILSTLGAANGRPAAASDGASVRLAWTDSLTNTHLVAAHVSSTGAVLAGPTSIAAAQAQSPAAVWTGSRLGVAYLETAGLVQVHLSQFAADTSFINDAALANATTTTLPSIAWTGDHYVAAFQTTGGVLVKFVAPP